MRKYRLFGVVTAVLLGTIVLHQPPSAPHHDHQQTAGSHLGGTDIELASATLPADRALSPLALGEESPVGLARPVVTQRRLGDVPLARTGSAPAYQAWAAEGDEMHIGLLRPAGTRYVKALYAWVSYEKAHAPPPPPPSRPAPAPAQKPIAVLSVAHHAAAPAAPVVPATSAASGGVWAALRHCESGGNYAEDTGNGYYGAYQFSPATWHGLGYPGLPSSAAPAVQDLAAQQLQARSGWGQWPACSAKLGLI